MALQVSIPELNSQPSPGLQPPLVPPPPRARPPTSSRGHSSPFHFSRWRCLSFLLSYGVLSCFPPSRLVLHPPCHQARALIGSRLSLELRASLLLVMTWWPKGSPHRPAQLHRPPPPCAPAWLNSLGFATHDKSILSVQCLCLRCRLSVECSDFAVLAHTHSVSSPAEMSSVSLSTPSAGGHTLLSAPWPVGNA